jgi:hypothetical protein
MTQAVGNDISTRDVRIVVASYRKIQASAQAILAAVIFMAAPYITFFSYGGHFISHFWNTGPSYILPGLAAIWVLTIIGFPVVVAGMGQLLLDNGKALWIKDGVLIFVRKWIFSVDCCEITKVEPGDYRVSTFVKKDGIVLRLKNGKTKAFPTGSFNETRAEVIDRLNTALNLAGSPL